MMGQLETTPTRFRAAGGVTLAGTASVTKLRYLARTELFSVFISTPLAIYFLAIAARIDLATMTPLLVATVVPTVLMSLAHSLWAGSRIDRAFALMTSDDLGMRSRAKVMLMRLPTVELAWGTGRWVVAIAIGLAVFAALAHVTMLEYATLGAMLLFSVPYFVCYIYLAAENVLARVVNGAELRTVPVSRGQVWALDEGARKLFMVISLGLIPTVVLGTFFVLSAGLHVEFTNLGFHLLVILSGMAVAIGVTLNEASRGFRRSLRDLLGGIDAMARGELTTPFVPMHTWSELGFVSQSFNALLEGTRDVMLRAKTASEVVNTGSTQLNASAQTLSQAAAEQATSVEEVTAAVEEIDNTVRENSQRAGQTSELAASAAARSETGRKAIQQTIESLRLIATKIDLVQEIAYQTNLLALNASIESARAGVHGRGFAVVASEVRRLAERSQLASKEIGEIMQRGASVAREAENIFGALLPDIQLSSELITDIAYASREQAAGMTQIGTAMSQLNDLAQRSASSAEELSATADSLSGHASELAGAVEHYRL